jgi:hypothetical protein
MCSTSPADSSAFIGCAFWLFRTKRRTAFPSQSISEANMPFRRPTVLRLRRTRAGLDFLAHVLTAARSSILQVLQPRS